MSDSKQDATIQAASSVRPAVRWFFRIREKESPPLTPEELRDWETFTAEPGHRRELGRVKDLWQVVQTLDELKVPSEAEVEADNYNPSWSIGEWQARRAAAQAQDQHSSRLSTRLYLLAAGIAAVAIGLASYRELVTSRHDQHTSAFVTPVAEQRTVNLEDGSVLTLGARTEAHSQITDTERVIVLDRGEAWFKVARDPRRPFRVLAGHGVITAVGTEFNVRRDLDAGLDRVTVTVGSGVVKVEPQEVAENIADRRSIAPGPVEWKTARLGKGEEMVYDDATGQRSVVRRADIEAATAWKQGRLEYIHEPLRSVVARVNRYSEKSIILADDTVGEIDFSGTVFEGQIDDWLRALQAAFPISIAESNERIVIHSRR